jgi:hypothetical protein
MSGGLDHSKEYIDPTSLHPFTIHSGQFHNAQKPEAPSPQSHQKHLPINLLLLKIATAA